MGQLRWILYGIVIVISSAKAEHFPGLRRTKPNQAGHSSWVSNDARETPEFLKTLNDLIEEQARRRFLEHLQRFQLNRNILQRTEQEETSRPAFTYQLPLKNNADLDKPIEFAVNPSDPRFYDNISDNDLDVVDKTIDSSGKDYDSEPAHKTNPNLPPSPQDIKPKLPIYHHKQKQLDNRLKYKEPIIEDNLMPQRVNGVIQRPVEMDAALSMYIVALIGGISAAVTVGLISVGIGWYTLHKKAKAAADVDYPAYGVTGPCHKDSSPSGDNRLAQSAQMYHYQHQKQQIIAMENHNNVDKNGPHSEAESEDENEEGDYTVYECPGLAPTGEMEVKNPLFADDVALTPGATQSSAAPVNKSSDGKAANDGRQKKLNK